MYPLIAPMPLSCRYLVLLLYTVVDLYGKPSPDVEEDYKVGKHLHLPEPFLTAFHTTPLHHTIKVVKSRLDECCRLQPRNPVPFKLRGDWCLRFPLQADR